ncbi:MAG: tRNA lysidine(34) synthetase TilS [Synergistaceae bacterium]|nr:tRNA lysidine(34) synthetase TilS [Synergistaceae bacterium]
MKEIFYFKKKLVETGKRQGWWDSAGLVAALSGGGDSVALLWLLHKFYPGRIVAAHLDHCTRDGASHEDAAFALELCRGWGIECRVKTVEVSAGRLTGESFEMAGRRVRYEHFNETAEAEGLPFIAVGHSADDLIETQLMNLFRGTGLAGLRGIPEVRGNIVRPIIGFRREELRSLLRGNGIPWREDASNADRTYTRNRVREELIPWIKNNLNPNFESSMTGLARQIEAELAERDAVTARNLERAVFDMPPALVCWKPSVLKEISDTGLADMLRAQGAQLDLPILSRDRTLKLAALVRKGGCWRFQWARDIEVCYSDRGIGWLHRKDVIKGVLKNAGKQGLPWWSG